MKKMAIYCGAYSGQPVYEQAARDLGAWLVANQFELVYGGGGVGLMRTLAESVLAAGGVVHGVMPANLYARGAGLAGLKDLEVVPDMAARKKRMLALADACVALPGGAGTLEEISEAFSWARVGDNASPCAFYNVNHYYDGLAAFYDHMVAEGFLTAADRSKLLFTADLTELGHFIDSYTPPRLRTYPKQGRA
ncbi:TIGR00730 family Rossman fold protein [Lacticaseibacillus camelliae]|uniref:Cytokinin riboside 5'-monophosphate phosphoribohydrolase n=1 Tax=Lacticaseibacillus camelliae DSM 22697 = JCM 13995 TaxID=1423730 RepID=A0A0R2F9F9_9LACO|nr:TIGR00730 family Rossman fold protein [Lacticaseibacillus camelliae]KRN22183.1 hypothetical protein FC75_GL001819 [Lacticaseibacillus camelliae DSM 22697 = JCM 13995]